MESEHNNPDGRVIIGHLLITLCRSEFEWIKYNHLDNGRLLEQLIKFCTGCHLWRMKACDLTIVHLVVALEEETHGGMPSECLLKFIYLYIFFKSTDNHH